MNEDRRQLNYDSSQINYVTEGTTYILNINKSDIPNAPATISSQETAKVKVPIDFLCEGIAFTAHIENPNNTSVGDCFPSTAAKINIRDTLSQESWIFTVGGALGQGTPVPASLLFGPKPTQLPAPRALYQNTMLEITIEPAGFDIVEFTMSFVGRRMDTMAQWERDLVCGDPRTSGAYWMFFDPMTLTRGDTAANFCGRGPEVNEYLRVPNLPFDVLVTALSGFVTANDESATPLARAWYEFELTDVQNHHKLNDGFIPSYLLGGSTFESNVTTPSATIPLDSAQILQYVPRSMPLNNAWLVRNQTAISLNARSVFSPLDRTTFPTIIANLMMIGMRVPASEISIGYPYYNREDGSLRCPPGSSGIPPGQPQGPSSNYTGSGNGPQGLGEGGYGNVPLPPRGVYMNNNPNQWPMSMPYPPPVLPQQQPIQIRNPMQEGGQVRMPNIGPGARGYGIPGGPADHRGPRFRNEGNQ